jgi:uncharacterized protein YdeI (YjbR/CyaY-like superfamily)
MEIGETLAVRSRAEWRRWLAKHHAQRTEIWLVYNKKTSGKGGITYDESVEEALCYGWIDGQNKTIDATSYHSASSIDVYRWETAMDCDCPCGSCPCDCDCC